MKNIKIANSMDKDDLIALIENSALALIIDHGVSERKISMRIRQKILESVKEH